MRTSGGEEFEISESSDGHLKIWARSGGNMLLDKPAGNVGHLIMWPNFQPIVPPTTKQPVIASREFITDVLKPKSNGLGSGMRTAVQKAIDRDPRVKKLLTEIVNKTLTKESRNDGGYETVVLRKEKK